MFRSLNQFNFRIMLYVVFFCSLVCMAHGLDDDNAVHPEDCAMMLQKGPEISENNASNNSQHEDQLTSQCIRYQDVNDALRRALNEIIFLKAASPDPDVDKHALDNIGRIITETTSILVKKFNLSSDQINYDLPAIDTAKTDIWEICPNMSKTKPCTVTRFRSYDGECTNLNNSVIGKARTAYSRFLLPEYSDGVSGYRVYSVDGSLLPNTREISILAHPDVTRMTDTRSLLLIMWGQFISHDISLADFPNTPDGSGIPCCVDGPKAPTCGPIKISEKDEYYWRHKSTCMDFHRVLAGVRPNCSLGPRAPTNFATSRIDAHIVYGSSYEQAKSLRTMKGGFMKTWSKFKELGLKDLLPLKFNEPNDNCVGRPDNMYCALTGDSRSSQMPHLLVLHLFVIREHNRKAAELGRLNPHWNDERTYQETRHLMIAIIQHISYGEMLPLLLGPDYMHSYNLKLQEEGYYHGYDKDMILETYQSLQAAALRWGHTLVPSAFGLYNKNHEIVGSWEQFAISFQPFSMYQPGMVDKVIGGSVNSELESFDAFVSHQLTNHLFQSPQATFGQDLAARNIERGRELGVPGYNDFREWCGMSRVSTFEELNDYLGNGTAKRYAQIYRHTDDIDLWSAGIAEYPVEGGTVGPTFACLLGRQFEIYRRADRYWYENPDFPSSFTPGQLREIRKITQAKIFCDNADDFPTIQMWTMLLPNPETNPRYNCEDLPQMDIKFWTENEETHEFVYSE